MVCWSKLCCEILLLLNMADMDCLYVEDCGVSSVEYSAFLVGVNRLSAFMKLHALTLATRSYALSSVHVRRAVSYQKACLPVS